MLTKLSLREFRAHRELDLDLEPLTVLIGPNGSGKTSILEAIYALNMPSEPDESPQLNLANFTRRAPGSPPQFPKENHRKMSIEAAGEEGPVTFSFSLSTTHPGPFVDNRLWGAVPAGKWGEFPLDHLQLDRSNFAVPIERDNLIDALGSSSLLRLDARHIAAPFYSEEAIPQLGESGAGLPSVLAHLKLSKEESFAAIQNAICAVIPMIKKIRIDRAAVIHPQTPDLKVWGHKILFDVKGGATVEAHEVGEGTILTLSVLTVALSPFRPKRILLDDLELALHPAAQKRLIEGLRAIMTRIPDLQVIATSHSPFILNYLKPEEARMVILGEDGVARCGKLTDHPDFPKWKDVMLPGEFWSTVGEKWLLEREVRRG